ncbi:MAG: AAA family ATPase [Bacilli bacterium]|nr:AAA family ATPase [Bacilli bacterium]
MHPKYSLLAQTTLTKAESLAFEFNSNNVDETHLMLSIIYQSDFITNQYFEDRKISYFKICSSLPKNKNTSTDNILFLDYSSSLKKILEKSISLSNELNEDKVSLNVICYCLLESKSKLLDTFCKEYNIDVLELKNIIIRTLSRKSELDNILDLTDLCKVKHDPLIGRQRELNMLIRTLKRRNKPNAILIGEPGIGKTSIVEELALLISKNKIEGLENYKVYELDMPGVVGGTKYRGEFEEKLKKIFKKVKEDKKAIIFIDEIHNIVKAGGAEGAIDASNIIKPYLSRNEICIIGATTINEYYSSIDKDKALSRRFNVIKLEPSSKEETLDILIRSKPIYEKFYKIKITEENLKYIIDICDKYLSFKYFPDKAIDLLDNSCVISNKELSKKDINQTLKDIYNIDISEEHICLFDEIKDTNINLHIKDEIISFLRNVKPNHINSILISGGQGVGKSYLGNCIANFLNKNSFIKIDLRMYKEINSFMSLFTEVSKNDVGYNLPSLIKLNPNTSIIFDNLQCVSEDVLSIICSLLEDEYIVFQNNKLNCSNLSLIFIQTKNDYSSHENFKLIENIKNESIYFSKMYTRFLDFIDKKIDLGYLNLEQAISFCNLHNNIEIAEDLVIDEELLHQKGYWYLLNLIKNNIDYENNKIKN